MLVSVPLRYFAPRSTFLDFFDMLSFSLPLVGSYCYIHTKRRKRSRRVKWKLTKKKQPEKLLESFLLLPPSLPQLGQQSKSFLLPQYYYRPPWWQRSPQILSYAREKELNHHRSSLRVQEEAPCVDFFFKFATKLIPKLIKVFPKLGSVTSGGVAHPLR